MQIINLDYSFLHVQRDLDSDLKKITILLSLSLLSDYRITAFLAFLILVLGYFSDFFGILQLFEGNSGIVPYVELKGGFDFIDYDNQLWVEEKEYSIEFGMVYKKLGKYEVIKNLFKKIFVEDVPNGTKIKIKYMTEIIPTRKLPSNCYTLDRINGYSKIYIINNEYVKEKSVKKIFITCNKPIDISEYKDNISYKYDEREGILEIINENETEIRNFPLVLPREINIKQISTMTRYILGIRFKPEEESDDQVILIRILEPQIGNQPSVVQIILEQN